MYMKVKMLSCGYQLVLRGTVICMHDGIERSKLGTGVGVPGGGAPTLLCTS